MNVLIVGTPPVGFASWQIRGVQLGLALGARLTYDPSDDDLRWADLVVLIKRAAFVYAARVRRAGLPFVWDALDFWDQPQQNNLDERQARARLAQTIRELQPATVITATRAMAEACEGVYLPHHARPTLAPVPAHEVIRVVGYEGIGAYLEGWWPGLDHECRRRGWQFVVNPASRQSVDLWVSLRGGRFDGWMCRQWKSGVKLINAMALGRPILVQHGAAASELGLVSMMTTLVDVEDISGAFDHWSNWATRSEASIACAEMAPAYTLDRVADAYRDVLQTVLTSCQAA